MNGCSFSVTDIAKRKRQVKRKEEERRERSITKARKNESTKKGRRFIKPSSLRVLPLSCFRDGFWLLAFLSGLGSCASIDG
jgi:hypothetical protein